MTLEPSRILLCLARLLFTPSPSLRRLLPLVCLLRYARTSKGPSATLLLLSFCSTTVCDNLLFSSSTEFLIQNICTFGYLINILKSVSSLYISIQILFEYAVTSAMGHRWLISRPPSGIHQRVLGDGRHVMCCLPLQKHVSAMW
uniref:Putative secreted protein n=1 Tax=Ixodes ricinus TaxID=34613 RepID=A0A6B0UU19_IXORI